MDDKSSKTPSNEKIIEDLTLGLDEACIEKGEPIKKNKFEKHSDGFKIDDHKDPWDKIGVAPDGESDAAEPSQEKIVEPKEDFIDEEALRDREVDLSEEEKENLRMEAEKLKNEGNNHFKSSEFRLAVISYTQAIQTCPLAFAAVRAILYANRAAAKAKYAEKSSAIEDCTKAIELDPTYLKAIIRRAQWYEQEDKLDEALADFKNILELDSQNSEANYAVRRLPPRIQERNEKLKDEMLGKLKDLGNMILKPFGLSTNNFQMEQDSSTGGYSVKFNQNGS